MASVLCVTLSIEWQCEQFACANVLPVCALGAAVHGGAKAKCAESENERPLNLRRPIAMDRELLRLTQVLIPSQAVPFISQRAQTFATVVRVLGTDQTAKSTDRQRFWASGD